MGTVGTDTGANIKNVMAGREQAARHRRLSVLAMADIASLVRLWTVLGMDPQFTMLRPPQTGLVGLRGRIGGNGDAFNFGEASITRATVRLETGEVGHAYCLGRDHARAKISAVIDALAQSSAHMAERIDSAIIDPLEEEIAARDLQRLSQTAATRVDFFTMVRGED